jgi:hypothetical protein
MERIGALPGGAVLVFALLVAIASAAFAGARAQRLRLRAGPAQA